jgi:tetratricopeptide (TPR) repeat protein
MTKQYVGAIEDNKAYLKLNPVHHEINYEIGMAYNQLGNYNEALQWLNKVISLKPELAVAYVQRAIAYYELKQLDKAKADARKARQMGVQNIDPRLLQ